MNMRVIHLHQQLRTRITHDRNRGSQDSLGRRINLGIMNQHAKSGAERKEYR